MFEKEGVVMERYHTVDTEKREDPDTQRQRAKAVMVGWHCESEKGDSHYRWMQVQSYQEIVSVRLDGPCRCGAVAPRAGPELVCVPQAQRCLGCGRSGHDWSLKVPGHRERPKIVCPDCWAEIG